MQQFTSDKRILYAAIEKVKWNSQGSGGVSAFAPIEATPDNSLEVDPSATPDDSEPTTTGDGQTLDDFRTRVFATGTLGAAEIHRHRHERIAGPQIGDPFFGRL